ncbi:hypothetical protein KCP78_03940 [Salmonella enterica subsp. enterica]|nr:hypothetical protein KCP78_03940 [Salmonella enterica subsp. enterica]
MESVSIVTTGRLAPLRASQRATSASSRAERGHERFPLPPPGERPQA